MATGFFKIAKRSIIPKGWGDYGDILQQGMTCHLPRVDGKLALERTGPYIPPITLPGIGDIVITSKARELLEHSGLSGFSFLPVEKVLIVKLHWELWNLDADKPAHYPQSGEPEDYVLDQQHNQSAANALGDLWEVAIPASVRSYKDLKLDLNTWNGADLIKSEGRYSSALFSQRARDWFTEQWGMYVRFDEFSTA